MTKSTRQGSSVSSDVTATGDETTRVFDAWINLPYAPGEVTPDPSVLARFKRGDSAYEGGQTMDDVVAEMDRLGISGGVLSKVPRDITPPFVHGTKTGEEVLRQTCERLAGHQDEYPGRFVTSVGIDPRLGYEAAKHVRIAVREYGIKCLRIIPMFTGIAIDDKLAYPLYTAACDEGAVVSINVGVPGPMKPAKLQRTILVDEVALAFPELKIVMSHLGDPWTSETVAMLIKHPNVFAMTAGWAPRYVPDDILSVIRRRNRTKLMWASDYPILPFERTITEGRAIEMSADSRRNFLGANALAVFGEPPATTRANEH
jgi:predicted TIM-barrel fold metal-dependent hydrolase